MNEADHYAFLESMLEDDTLSLRERVWIEEQLSYYYQCLSTQEVDSD